MSYRTTRPIPFGSRNMPYQFRATHALRGLSGLMRGLGIDMSTLGLENCGAYTDVGSQYACSQRNQAKINAASYEGPVNAPASPFSGTPYTSAGNCAQFPNAPGCAAPIPPTTTSTTYSPSLSFNTSRGGNNLLPGDTWTITITGAPPNQPVSVLGVHPDGGSATQGYGNTDASGNFKLAGTITADMVGTWHEVWTVGGQQAGNLWFAVAAAPAPGASSSAGQQSQPLPQLQQLPQTTNGTTSTSTSFLSDIPWWGWGIAAVGGFMLFSGGKKR